MHKGTNTLNKFNRAVSVVDRCVIQQYNTSRVDPIKRHLLWKEDFAPGNHKRQLHSQFL